MKKSLRIRWIRTALAVAAVVVSSTPARSQGSVVESGFRVRHYSCVPGNPNVTPTIFDAECSPGGTWGDFVYLAVGDPGNQIDGAVVRIAANGRESTFLSPRIPVSMAFSAPAGPFEDRLWVNDVLMTPGMYGVNPPQGLTPLFTCAKPGAFTFDPTGSFGYEMYLRGSDGIYSLDVPACDPTLPPPTVLFATTSASPLSFGPGGGWGTDLYATGGEIFAPNGSSTLFAFPFTEIAWGSGSRWNGDMFARQAGSSDIYRVQPDGTATLFATGFQGKLIFCVGSLWIMQSGDCAKITAKGH